MFLDFSNYIFNFRFLQMNFKKCWVTYRLGRVNDFRSQACFDIFLCFRDLWKWILGIHNTRLFSIIIDIYISVFIFSYYKMPLPFIEIVRSKLRAQQKNCMLYMYILEILKFRFLKNVCNIPSMQAHFKVRLL